MKQPRFSIVIPTRERAETLFWSLRTCVMQDCAELEIVVSDNFSGDNTKEIVDSVDDSRVRYINTGRRLSMSQNWEFGLAHATGEYVSILGDDDGFLPDSITAIDSLLRKYPGIKAITWAVSQYRWPNYIVEEDANKLLVNTRSGYKVQSARRNIRKTIFKGQDHRMLPWLYSGFVERKTLNVIKERSGGRFFHSQMPDIYSAIAIASTIDKYILSNAPYSIAGTSGSSNGVSYFNPHRDQTAATNFSQEGNIPFHKLLILCPSIQVMVIESALQARDIGLLSKELLPDISSVLKHAVSEVTPSTKHQCYSAFQEIIRINGLSPRIFDDLEARAAMGRFKVLNKVVAVVRENSTVEFKSAEFGVTNIYEAALAHDRIAARRPAFVVRLAKQLLKRSCSYVLRLRQARSEELKGQGLGVINNNVRKHPK